MPSVTQRAGRGIAVLFAMLAETFEAVSLERRLLRFLVESLKQIVKKEDITLSGKPSL
jgi:hypothetical protein